MDPGSLQRLQAALHSCVCRDGAGQTVPARRRDSRLRGRDVVQAFALKRHSRSPCWPPKHQHRSDYRRPLGRPTTSEALESLIAPQDPYSRGKDQRTDVPETQLCDTVTPPHITHATTQRSGRLSSCLGVRRLPQPLACVCSARENPPEKRSSSRHSEWRVQATLKRALSTPIDWAHPALALSPGPSSGSEVSLKRTLAGLGAASRPLREHVALVREGCSFGAPILLAEAASLKR